LEPAHPIAIILAASLEAIDALPGAERGSPRIVPDETKLAITDGASRGFIKPVTFGAIGHCFLPCAHLRRMQPRRIVTSTSIERGSTWDIQMGHDADTKAYDARTWS
jgi:hypothetical protein